MDTNYINIIKGAFIKNIVKIIVVGIVCSIALVCEKSFTTDFVVESGDLIQTKIIKVNDPNDSPLSDKSVDYRGIAPNRNISRYPKQLYWLSMA